ncbi:Beta-mannosidase, glycosyl hydrolase family 2 [Halorhabdus sp. SVX81]|uniref:glycosyl hydrolase 2 galactose-binding domain-containing protein n=1 Tax=Halorhabdus sp. SVX81 TaxID=2978283 RepID=UPI0023DC104E|nr:hydrolase [Halorhabdus sp. SVX81]WEL18032.1 Beta-mannosidase, glycosyl hydrolase family 2 [Halorhabdus sp. SVX81]
MVNEWRAATVEPGGDQPAPATWEPVEVPGRPADFAGSDAVAYRSTFEDPRDGDEHAMVVFEGVYAHARVWLNDTFLGEHDTYFEPLRLRLDGALAPENELVVECRRPDDRFGGSYETDDVPDERAVPGIWWNADIATYTDSHILDLSARPRVDDDGARFEVRTTILAETDLEDRVTFSVKPEGSRRGRGMMDRTSVTAAAGERTTVEYTIDVRDPALWWPHDLGEQNRYVLRAKLGDDERTLTTGLCSIRYDDTDGLRVNDTPITARGVGLLAAEPADIEQAVELNANLVRAHAHVPSPAVYEAADEAGVLVWQDLPLTGPGPFDIERGRTLVDRIVSAYDHHPGLAAISVHDDPISLSDGALGSGLLDRLRLRWRRFRADYDHEPAETVAEAVPDEIVALPVVGPPGIEPDATALYPGWKYGDAADVDQLLDRHPALEAIVGEYGAGSIGVPEPENMAGFDQEIHDTHVSGGIEPSQAYQRSVIKTITERLRLRASDVIVAASLRDLSDAGMGVLTRNGKPKQAHDALTDAFEPVQAVLAEPSPGAESDVVVLNDTPSEVVGHLSWDIDGDTDETAVSVGADSRKTVASLSIPTDAEFVTLSLTGRSATNTYRL